MAITLLTLLAKLGLDSGGFVDGMDKAVGHADKGCNNISQSFTKSILSAKLLEAAVQGVVNAGKGLITYMGDAITASSSMAEALSKNVVVFGRSSDGVLDFAKNAALAMGMSTKAALDGASGFGYLFRSLGIAETKSADMSQSLVKLAADLGSINNTSVEDAMAALQSGLIGQAEPMRKLGILIDVAAVKQEALNMGLITGQQELDANSKALATYSLIMKQSALAQDDFKNTAGGLANQLKIQGAIWDNLKVTIGDALLPLATAWTTMWNAAATSATPALEGMAMDIRNWALTTVSNFFAWGADMVQTLAGGILAGTPAVVSALNSIATYFTYMLQANSPPRLLPDLDKWGASAMQSYLAGWSEASAGAGSILNDWGDELSPFLKQIDLGSLFTGDMKKVISGKFGDLGGMMSGYVSSYADLRTATQGVTDAQKELAALGRGAPVGDYNAAKRKLYGAQEVEAKAKIAFEQSQNFILKEAEAQDKLTLAINNQMDALSRQASFAEEAAARQAEASARQAEAAAKSLDSARLMWQMAQTDTAGKIKLIEAESAKHAQGSQEWYQLETQKLGLMQQLESQQLAVNKAGAGMITALPDLKPLQEEIGSITRGLVDIGPELFIDPLTMQIQLPPANLFTLIKNLGISMGGEWIKGFIDIAWARLLVKLGLGENATIISAAGTLGTAVGKSIADAMWSAISAKLTEKWNAMWANIYSFKITLPMLGGGLIPVTPWANGFDGVISSPTLALMGEAGPERVTVTPFGKEATGREGNGDTINYNLTINTTDRVDVLPSFELMRAWGGA